MASFILEPSLRATFIIIAVALVLKVMRIKSAGVLHAVWSAVTVVMLALPVLIGWAPKAHVAVPPGVRSFVASHTVASGSLRAESEPSDAPRPAPQSQSTKWPMVFTDIYLLVLGTLLLRIAVGMVWARRFIREAIAHHGTLSHPACATPVTIGWIRPAIILPTDWLEWPQSKRDAVLTHEREHVRRYHPLFQTIALINRAVFWFHPLAWWLERRLSGLAEEACDLSVLSNGHDPHEYSGYLLETARSVSQTGRRLAHIGMAMPGSHLPRRIRQILAGHRAVRISRLRLACTIGACAAIVVTLVVTTFAYGQQPVLLSSLQYSIRIPKRAATPLRSSESWASHSAMPVLFAHASSVGSASQAINPQQRAPAGSGALTSSDPAERAAAACELGRTGNTAVIPQLISLLDDGTPLPQQIFCGTEPPFEDESWAPDYPEVREPSPGEAATRALLALGDGAVSALAQTLTGAGNWRARKNAAWALAHRGQLSDSLIAALSDSAWQVRTEAAYALFQRGGNSPQVIAALSSALFDNAWQVREQATLALGHKGDGAADVITPLLTALRDQDPRVRLAATVGLWHKSDRRAWSALFDALKDSEESVRSGAALALGNRALDPDVQLLIAARHDADPRIREGVREALRIVELRMRGTTTNLSPIQIPFD